MQTRDQKYAIDAYTNVTAVKNAPDEEKSVSDKEKSTPDKKKSESDKEKRVRKYGVMCHKLPLLIHTAGLAQALAFVESRKGKIYETFLKDLGKTLEVVGIAAKAREAELNEYMRLTQQVMEALVWYKRFAQSILGVDASDTEEEVE
jgi:CRISPR-associated protein Cmr5